MVTIGTFIIILCLRNCIMLCYIFNYELASKKGTLLISTNVSRAIVVHQCKFWIQFGTKNSKVIQEEAKFPAKFSTK